MEPNEPWKLKAACMGMDPELFFPERGQSTSQARKTCRSCPVQKECRNYAIVHHERFGIWGGLTARELRPLQRAHNQQRAG